MSPLRGCLVLATTLTLLAIAGRAVAATDYLYALVDVTGSNNRLSMSFTGFDRVSLLNRHHYRHRGQGLASV
jgi:hypothetical protein